MGLMPFKRVDVRTFRKSISLLHSGDRITVKHYMLSDKCKSQLITYLLSGELITIRECIDYCIYEKRNKIDTKSIDNMIKYYNIADSEHLKEYNNGN